MIVSCHQPNYLPYLGFFDKMKKSDVFVLYDAVQFSDGSYQHRNRIRTPTGWMWLTIPVERKRKPINEIEIKPHALISQKPWQEHHWRVIYNTYHKTPYFKTYEEELKNIFLGKSYTHLADLTTNIIASLAAAAGITTKTVQLSELNVHSNDASERLALVTQALGGDVYLSGPSGGSRYELRDEEFTKRGVAVAFQEFHHPEYPQYHARFNGTFEKNMAAIDALFNTGTLPI